MTTAEAWTCSQGHENPQEAAFCLECGEPKPEVRAWFDAAFVAMLEKQLQEAQGNIVTLFQQVVANTQAVERLEPTVESLKNQVSQLRTDVDQLRTDLSQLSERVGEINVPSQEWVDQMNALNRAHPGTGSSRMGRH